MSITVPRSLYDKIEALVPEVDATLRAELEQSLRTLREAGDVPGTIVGVSRFLEGGRGLLGRIAAAHGQQLKGHILIAQIDELAQKGLLPPELASNLHWVRVYATRARHHIEKIALSVDDAAIALYFALRVLEWFYCACARGPCLPTLYTTAERPGVEAYRRYYLDCVARFDGHAASDGCRVGFSRSAVRGPEPGRLNPRPAPAPGRRRVEQTAALPASGAPLALAE